MEIKAQKLAVPQILTDRGTTSFKDFTDRKVKHKEPLNCQSGQWAFCYSYRDENIVNQLIDTIRKGQSSLGMNLNGDPLWIEVPDDNEL